MSAVVPTRLEYGCFNWNLLGIVALALACVALAFLFFEIFFQFSFLLSVSADSINKSLRSVKCLSTSVKTYNMLLLTAPIKSSDECEFLMQ